MPARIKLTRRNKYRAVKTEVDGIVFHSKREAKRYGELRLLEKAGEILQLRLQVKYAVNINGIKVCEYRADFAYYDCENKCYVIEDCKGVRTAVYRLKKKLVEAYYGITVRET
jgi:Protein of unknown function (DUF1064)